MKTLPPYLCGRMILINLYFVCSVCIIKTNKENDKWPLHQAYTRAVGDALLGVRVHFVS